MITIVSAILSVALIEIMLSLDNALVNASLAKKLPHELQHKALIWGITLGGFFRISGLLLASFLITNPAIKILSALYLFWLAYEHLFAQTKPDWQIAKVKKHHFIITQLILANLVFSIDNILGVVGISHHIIAIVFGVIIGIVVLIYTTPFVLKLMHQFPSMEKMTYILLIYIGSITLIEEIVHYHVPEYITFFCIALAMTAAVRIDKGAFKR